jgi:hypothetical protein
MKSKKSKLTDTKNTRLDRICEELGEDTIKKLHRAFELTAAALYRRAQQRAEAEMQKADQYRTTV